MFRLLKLNSKEVLTLELQDALLRVNTRMKDGKKHSVSVEPEYLMFINVFLHLDIHEENLRRFHMQRKSVNHSDFLRTFCVQECD